MILRGYQASAALRVQEAWSAGRRAPLVVMPTGGGKTCTGASLVRDGIARGERWVWLAHRRELIAQARKTLSRFGLDVGSGELNAGAPVLVESVQTLLARGTVPPADGVAFDEAHHFAADEWGKLCEVYRAARFFGLTATPVRGDGRPLHMFDHLIVAAQIKDLVDMWRQDNTTGLVPCDVKRPSRHLRPDELAEDPVDAYRKHTPNGHAVVFAPHVKAANDYATGFHRRNIRAIVVHGKMGNDERASALYQFDRGTIPVLVNVNVLTEGWDSPICDTIVIARGCGSAAAYLQMVGRGLRPFGGKLWCRLLDLRGVTWSYGRPEQERDYDLESGSIRIHASDALDRFCRVCSALLVDGECPECTSAKRPQGTPHAIGEELEDWRDEMAALPATKMATMLAAFYRDAFARGGNKVTAQKAAHHRFRGTFKRFPSADIVAEAFEHNRKLRARESMQGRLFDGQQ